MIIKHHEFTAARQQYIDTCKEIAMRVGVIVFIIGCIIAFAVFGG